MHVRTVRAAPGTTPTTPLTWQTEARTLTREDRRAFREDTLPQGTGPRRVVVWDHASMHRGKAMKDAGPALTAQGIDLWYLPPTPRSGTRWNPCSAWPSTGKCRAATSGRRR